jgi:hypothetical protein
MRITTGLLRNTPASNGWSTPGPKFVRHDHDSVVVVLVEAVLDQLAWLQFIHSIESFVSGWTKSEKAWSTLLSKLRCLSFSLQRTSHAGAGGGCGRSSAMSRNISWNICRGMATSAIWKAT